MSSRVKCCESRARTSESGRYCSVRSAPISPIGMVSINVKSKPRPCAQRIRSSISSSLTSRSATVLILIAKPGARRRVDAAQHLREVASPGDLPEFRGVERVERDIDAGHAASGERLGMVRKLACIGGQRQLVEALAQMPRQPLDQPHDVPPHQRLAAGQPELAHAARDEGARQPVDLLEAQQILARQEVHRLGHAIDAAKVAAVGDRDAQIGDPPAKRSIKGGPVMPLRFPRLALGPCSCGYRPWRS